MTRVNRIAFGNGVYLRSTRFAVFRDTEAVRDVQSEKRREICSLIVDNARLPARCRNWSSSRIAFETENPKQNTECAGFISKSTAANRREGQV